MTDGLNIEGAEVNKEATKEAPQSPEVRAAGALLKGFSFVKEAAGNRDDKSFANTRNTIPRMVRLAGILVRRARGEVVHAETLEMDTIINEINTVFSDVNERTDSSRNQPAAAIEEALTHLEVFPLAVHDMMGPLTSLIGFNELINADEASREERRAQFSKNLSVSWDKLEEISTDTLEFFSDPLKSRRDISLPSISLLMRELQSNAGFNVTLDKFPDDVALGRSINFSPFLLRSLVTNCFQNTLRAADGGVQDSPEINIKLSLEGEKAFMRLDDNAGGISDDFLERRKAGGYTSDKSKAASTGTAMTALESLIAKMGAKLDFENIVDGQGKKVGARVIVAFPLNYPVVP